MHRAADLGTASMGVWRRAEAVAAMGRSGVQHRLREGTWQSPLPGVYADGGYDLSPEQWGWAAALTGTRPGEEGIACLRSAARIWDFTLIDDNDPATGAREALLHDVSSVRGLRGRTGRPGQDAALRHRFAFAPEDLMTLESGLVVSSPIRTAMDCAATLNIEAAVCLLDAALRAEAFSNDQLARAIAAREGLPGGRAVRTAFALSDRRAESPAETLARLLLLPVLPSLVPQVELRDRWGNLIARFDLADQAVKLAFEADGKRGHAGSAMVAKDRARDRRTEDQGWWTERGTGSSCGAGRSSYVHGWWLATVSGPPAPHDGSALSTSGTRPASVLRERCRTRAAGQGG
jgi:hypothetical protein